MENSVYPDQLQLASIASTLLSKEEISGFDVVRVNVTCSPFPWRKTLYWMGLRSREV